MLLLVLLLVVIGGFLGEVFTKMSGLYHVPKLRNTTATTATTTTIAAVTTTTNTMRGAVGVLWVLGEIYIKTQTGVI